MRYGALTPALLMLGGLFGCQGEESASPAEIQPVTNTQRIATAEPGSWMTYGGTYAEQRYADLDDINRDTVADLGLAWYFEFDTHRGQESTPLMVDGVIYVTTAWSKVYALDAASGEELWRYDPEVPKTTGINACCDVVNRGAAFYEGKVFVGTIDGRLIAIDAANGKPVWSKVTVDQSKPYIISGAPRAAKGKVFIGNGGAEYGVRGYVSAYDVDSGELAWRFYTVPGDPEGPADGAASDKALKELAAPTWHGRGYLDYGGGGGTVWDSIVYDPELDQLYIGTGNGSPWNRVLRSDDKGDNLFLSSVVALDPDTGSYIWHYQETPGETWDYTATQQITLATLDIDGSSRQVLLHAPKNGFFYVIDRTTGQVISAEKFVPVNWAERVDVESGRPIETPGSRYLDAPFLSVVGGAGAHNWQPMSYSPQTGLVYIPAQEVPFVYTADEKFVYKPGEWNLGVLLAADPLPEDDAARAEIAAGLQGRLLAWDPIKQSEAWRVEHDGPWNGGTLATAGGLVFQGLTDQTFRAYDAGNGEELWSYATEDAIITGPIAYLANDTQHIAVTVGNGGGLPLTLPTFDQPEATPNGRLLVFKLGGAGALPKRVMERPDPVLVEDFLSAEQSATAFTLYGRFCSSCHGIESLTAGVLPDLRRSPALADAQLWRSIVLDGAFSSKGMVSFGDKISESEAELLRGYVAQQAQRLAASAE
jgi:PQQ-dependent dehydrogenase (methanol/ethanol family)